MKSLSAIALTLALALAPCAAGGADLEQAAPREEPSHVEQAPAGATISRVGQALSGLGKLRLRPAHDGFDVSETTRARPETRSE